MKKNRFLLTIALVVAMSFGTIVGAMATTNYENIQAILSYTREIIFDDEVKELRDVNENTVYPISYKGTTYLPIRAISGLTGLKVDYDEKEDRVLLNTEVGSIINDDKIVVSLSEYNNLKAFEEKYAKLEQVMNYAKAYYLYSSNDKIMMNGALKGSIAALGDKYSEYLTPKEMKELLESTTGNFVGIGVQITAGNDNKIVIVSPISGGPAEEVGLRAGDKIIAIDGVEYTAEQMSEASNVLKGEPDTLVKVTIERQENGKIITLDVDIIRKVIKNETITSSVIKDNIGYIKISSFDEQTPRDFLAHLDELQSKKIKALILDLRNNPGGVLDSTCKISDVLLGESLITYTKTRSGVIEKYESDKDKIDIPYVLLINGGSASASEVMAGAVKDTKSGTLVGTKTFGKGIVQRIQYLGIEGDGIKMTISEYFTPNNINIHGVGIEPDIVVELNANAKGIGPEYYNEDNQLQKAVEILNAR